MLLLIFLTPSAWAQNVLISFDSVDGHTEKVANWIADGVRHESPAALRLKRIEDTTHQDLVWADAILIGGPVYNAGLTPKVATFLAEWPFEGSPLKDRVGAAFVSSKGATAGSENALFSIIKTMMMFRMVIVGGEDWRSGFGVSYVRDGESEQSLYFLKIQAVNLGKRVCRLARETQALRQKKEPTGWLLKSDLSTVAGPAVYLPQAPQPQPGHCGRPPL